jgi:hypothetical protein
MDATRVSTRPLRSRRRSDPAHTLGPAVAPAESIAARAYELFLARGGEHGRDLDDWLRAESELVNRAAGVDSN